MSRDYRVETDAAPFRARRVYGWIAAATAAFAIYVSLIPFEFRFVPFGHARARFERVMFTAHVERTSRSNYLANALLFVPVGFGASGALLAGRRRSAALAAVPATLALSVAVSGTAEFLQIFVPGRIVSRADVVAQTLGCAAGIAAWMAAGRWLTAWLRAASDRQRGDRVARALSAYAVLWVFVKLAPFDFTVDLGHLAQRYRRELIALAPGAGVSTAQRVWDAALALLSAAPLGALGLVGWTGLRARRHSPAAFAFGAAFVLLAEAAQIFIRSHAAYATDLLWGLAGVALGVWGARYALLHRQAVPVLPERAFSWTALGALLGWTGVLAAYHWQPYAFTLDSESIRRQLDGVSLIPFAGYWTGSELTTFKNVLVKIVLALPFGIIASAVLSERTVPPAVANGVWVIVAAAVFGAIEMGQLLLPMRTPDPTDVLVSVAGAAAGLWIGRWVRS